MGVLSDMTFQEYIEEVAQKYIAECGRDKFLKVLEKVMTANKPNKLIAIARMKSAAPSPKECLACICEVPFFFLQSNKTQAVAANLLLNRWDEEVNRDIDILDDLDLIKRGIAIFAIYDIVY